MTFLIGTLSCFTSLRWRLLVVRLPAVVLFSLGSYSYSDETLPCSPNHRRPDFTWVLEDRLVILEVDEDAHRFYNRECELLRVTELRVQEIEKLATKRRRL